MSSLYRILRCPAYIQYLKYVKPKPSSEAAIRGTICHEWQNYWILIKLLGYDPAHLMPPTQPLTKDEREAVLEIIDYVQDILGRYPDAQVLTERYMAFPQNVVPQEDCGGTPDVVIYSQSHQIAFVLDSKFGRVYVDANDNSQGTGYAVSALWHVPVRDVVIIIAQPFSPGPEGKWIREWHFTSEYLVEFQATVEQALVAAESPNPQPAAGTHCTYCAVELVCPARKAQMESAMGRDFGRLTPQMFEKEPEFAPVMREIPDDELAKIFLLEKTANAFFSAAKREATLRAKQGRTPPGTKLVDAQGKSVWQAVPKKNGSAARGLAVKLAAIIGKAVGMDDKEWADAENFGYFEKQVDKFVVTTTPNLGETKDAIRDEVSAMLDLYRPDLTPAEKRKRLTEAGHMVDMLTYKPKTGEAVLVPASSAREPWNPAIKAFAGVKLKI